MDVVKGLRAHYDDRRPGWQLLDHAGEMRDRIASRRAAAEERRRRAIAGTVFGERIVLPYAESSLVPRVSVVIFASEDCRLDRRCIASLATHPARVATEVLLVTDGPDASVDAFWYATAGVRVFSNAAAIGFARSVNRAARHTRGEFVFLLGSESLVLPGSIDRLVEAMDEPTIGLVGAKVTTASGELRTAGGLIWNDGSVSNIGSGRPHSSPEYNFRRDVDVCSVAALMVRRDVLAEIGFLDGRLAGNYSAADLCLATRALGYRVVYEPRAEVIDEGNGSAQLSTAPSGRGRATTWEARAPSLFTGKWEPALRDRSARPARHSLSAELRASARDTRPRVLVCDWAVPTPDRDSGSHRMDWILRLLSPMCSGVTLVPTRRFALPDNQIRLQNAGVEVRAGDHQTLSSLLATRAGMYDLVILSRSQVARQHLSTIRRLEPNAKVLFDTVELTSLRLDLQRRQTGTGRDRNIARERALENQLIRASDAVAAVSEEERAEIIRRAPASRTVVLPNVHEVTTLPAPEFAARRDLIFIGNFTHPPNVDAVDWFSTRVLPIIRTAIDVRLRVIGPGATARMAASWGPFVRYEGWVRDILPHYHAARIAIAPLRYGAGVKGKIGQALSLGVPVVTTSPGASGMDLLDGTHVLIADAPLTFANAVVSLYNDEHLWNRLSAGGLAVAAERWSPDAMRARLEDLLHTALGLTECGARLPDLHQVMRIS